MKGLIKNYIDLLTIERLNEFSIKNDIILNDQELNYVFNLIKTSWNNILKDDTIYLNELKNNVSNDNYLKIKELYIYYKNRYKGYLF